MGMLHNNAVVIINAPLFSYVSVGGSIFGLIKKQGMFLGNVLFLWPYLLVDKKTDVLVNNNMQNVLICYLTGRIKQVLNIIL